MEISLEWLIKNNACRPCMEWFKNQTETDVEKLVMSLLNQDHFDWANWLLSRALTNQDKVRYAIYAAEQVLHIFEEKYPSDNRPRKAIEAAKDYLNNKNRAAAYAAAYAADAARAAADTATYATDATDAAYAADAADAAAFVSFVSYVSNTARAAVYATYTARAAAYAADALKKQIIEYGLTLIKED